MKARARHLLITVFIFSLILIHIYRRTVIKADLVTPAQFPPNKGIFLVETTDTLEPTSLTLCAVESAARIYPDRPIFFYMGGLRKWNNPQEKHISHDLQVLTSLANVYIQPFDLEEILKDSPLLPWYLKVNPATEKFWTHVSSDASRLALVWKYGGIYFDTDVISIRPIPEEEFLVCAYTMTHTSNGIFGFNQFQPFLWDCMKEFAVNYKGQQWGYQGPQLVTRVLQRLGQLPKMDSGGGDSKFYNFSYLHPHRFYPIPPHSWEKFFEPWDPKYTFVGSYGLHFFNFMNYKKSKMIIGSNSLAERLYRQHCPNIYSREKEFSKLK
ncbi:alpha-1,4-N-acetylglucosaminyltransferase-like [Pleurodeles waltl]|uniref:alpha-1,4-N-acetylglucosaminyltransferase-like n=1 Tax=Pleurodeles waltl TaxID=8319 RepID=UPI0037097ECD